MVRIGHAMSDLNLKLMALHSPHTLLLELKNNLENYGFWVWLMFEVFKSLLGMILLGLDCFFKFNS